MTKKLSGANWTNVKLEFDRWRTAGQSIFPEEVWKAADTHHGYQWWYSFGDDFEHLKDLATSILSKPISASACEFSWSDVSQVITKKANQRKDDNVERMVNIRAMYKLEDKVMRKVMLGNIPKLDDFLDSLVNAAISESGGHCGDDAPDVELESDHESEDDDLGVVDEDEDDLYELGARNADLEIVLAQHL